MSQINALFFLLFPPSQFPISRFKPNRWLKFLSINFFLDDVETFDAEGLFSGHSEGVFARILLSAIGIDTCLKDADPFQNLNGHKCKCKCVSHSV